MGVSGVSCFDCVGVVEGAGPFGVAVGEDLVGPAVFVSSDVVVAAARCEVVDVGPMALRPFGSVVEIAFGGWHATPGEDAGGVCCFDDAALPCGWSALCGAGGHGLSVVGNCVAPLCVGL